MHTLRHAVLVLSSVGMLGWSLTAFADAARHSGGSPPSLRQGWRAEADMLDAATYVSAGELDGIVYVAGGINSFGPTASFQAYDPATNGWTNLAPLPETRYQSDGVADIDGKLYVPGGWNGAFPTNTLYVYDPATNEWTTKAPLPHLSACGVSGVIAGKLYVTTPCNGLSIYHPILDVYDPAKNTWTGLQPSHIAHGAGAGAVINGKLYLAGGLGTGGPLTNVNEVYDPATNTWTQLAPIPVPVQGPASVELDGKLWVFGGSNGTDIESLVQVYDPANDNWKISKFALPAATVGAAATVAYGIAFFEGGGTGTGVTGTNDALFVLPSIP